MLPLTLMCRARFAAFRASAACALSALVFTSACGTEATTGTTTPQPQPVPPPSAPAPTAVASLDVTPAQVTLNVGSAQTLAATAKDAAGNALSRTVTWSTSSPAVATVDSAGKVTALAAGVVNIRASSEGKNATARVTVVAAPVAGVVSGRVTDTRGQPIAGAKIVINNALWFNRNVVLRSGTDGSYRFTLPPTDAWYVRGTTDVTYHGRTYTVELKPDYAGSFAGVDGRVVNLQWTMTGEVSRDFGGGGFYGGEVQMDADIGVFDLNGVVMTLTPVGPLLDGSAGQVITRSVVGTMGFLRLQDIPIGRYTIRATRNGETLLVRMRHTTSAEAEVTALFEPAYVGATVHGLYFSVAPPA